MLSNLIRPRLRCGVYPDFMTDKPEIDPVRRGLGMRLASARQAKGFTQTDIAVRFSVSKGTVSAWETGRGIPDALTLRELAKIYDVSADSLLWEDSLSPEAMKFAAAFDSLNEQQRRTLNAIWMAYVQESASDAAVRSAMPITAQPPMNMGPVPDIVVRNIDTNVAGWRPPDTDNRHVQLNIPGTGKTKGAKSDQRSTNPEPGPSERGEHTPSPAPTGRTRKT